MQYRFILDWIDGELRRLEAARTLLLDVPPSAGKPLVRRRKTSGDTGRDATKESPSSRAPETLAKLAEPKASARRRKTPLPEGGAVELRALSGTIPLRPVAVSAAEVMARRSPVPPRVNEKIAPPEEGTLEALVRELRLRPAAL